MEIIDLTQIIAENMPVYPGTASPKLEIANTVEKDGFKETLLTMCSHTGTHMDAPAHVFSAANTLDTLEITHFCGNAMVIDCTDVKEGGSVTMEHIKRAGKAAEDAEFLLFHTGWSERWHDKSYFGAYPRFDEAVIRFAASNGRKGIGIDAISIDPIDSVELPMHRIVFAANMIIIENLTNLDKLSKAQFTLYALPLRYKYADGSPIRAIAVL